MIIETTTFQILAIAHALEFYHKTGMKVNSAYTPTRMIAMARKLTGDRTIKARDYLGAATALRALLEKV